MEHAGKSWKFRFLQGGPLPVITPSFPLIFGHFKNSMPLVFSKGNPAKMQSPCPPKTNMTSWKIHHEWRCISYWKWEFPNVMLVFRGVICKPRKNDTHRQVYYAIVIWGLDNRERFGAASRFRSALLRIQHPSKFLVILRRKKVRTTDLPSCVVLFLMMFEAGFPTSRNTKILWGDTSKACRRCSPFFDEPIIKWTGRHQRKHQV